MARFKKKLGRQGVQAFLGASSIVLFFCVICWIFQLVSISFNGFGVDSAGRLYVGLDHHIEVIEDGQVVRTIRKFTSRGYYFTVTAEDTILLSTGSKVLEMDLQGEEKLNSREDPGSETYHELRKKTSLRTASGETYTATNYLGFLQIYKEGERIYHTPVIDYTVEVLLFISLPCFIISLFLLPEARKKISAPPKDEPDDRADNTPRDPKRPLDWYPSKER